MIIFFLLSYLYFLFLLVVFSSICSFLLHSIMNRLRAEEVKQLPQNVQEHKISKSTNDNGDNDDIFIENETNDDQQAQMRRRAPTRHSIKSLSGRKTLTKQSSSTEVKSITFLFFLSFFLFFLLYFRTKTSSRS